MSTTTTYNPRQIRKILQKNGYMPVRQSGSHIIYTNEQGNHITMKCNKCNKMIFQRLIKENNLSIKM